MAKSAILSVKIIGDSKGAVDAMGKVEEKSGKLGGLMKGLGGAALGAATVAGGALIGLGVVGVKEAGNLQQSMGAVDAVFKGSADQVHGFADAAATELGLTGNEYRELATLMGAQLKNGGTSIDELAGKTNDLMTAGADMASMFGGTTSDAVSAISSALKGERDPIEKYGVSLKQAGIDARAAEMGFTKVGGALSDEAQQAATLSLIMEQTGDAHGNFAKETGTLAGQQQILTAQWGNFTAQIGMLLLPALTALLSFMTGSVMPGLQEFATVVGPHITAAIEQVGPMITGLLDNFNGLGGGTGALLPIITAVKGAFAAIAPAVASFLPGLITFGQTVIPVIIGAVQAMIPLIMQVASVAIPAILGVIGGLLPIVQNIITTVVPAVIAGVQTLIPTILAMVPPIMSIVGTIIDVLGPAIDWLLPIVVGVFGALVTQVQGAIEIITGVLTAVAALLRGDFSGAWQGVKDAVGGAIKYVSGVVDQGMALIGGLTGQTVAEVKATFVQGFALIRARTVAAISGMVSSVKNFIGNLASSITSRVSSIRTSITTGFNAARAMAVGAFTSLVSGVLGKVNGLLSTIRQLPSRIRSSLGNLGSLLRSAGQDLIRGLINGVGSMGSALSSKARGLANGAVSSIKGALGIASPSKVMHQIGIWTGEGLIDGVEKMRRGAAGAMADLVTVPDAPTIPLSVAGGRGAGITINEGDITIQITGVVDDSMARKIEQAIVRAKQRTGTAAGARLVAGVA